MCTRTLEEQRRPERPSHARASADMWPPRLPSWLLATAERAHGPVPLPQHAVTTERKTTCTVVDVEGFKVLSCTETRELLRLCADG